MTDSVRPGPDDAAWAPQVEETGGRPVMLGADDFTVRGGSGDAAIHAKQVFSEEYANAMRLPVVRLTGSSRPGRQSSAAAPART